MGDDAGVERAGAREDEMRSGWGRMKARNSLRVGRRRIAVAEVVLCVGLVWAAWASVPAVESAARAANRKQASLAACIPSAERSSHCSIRLSSPRARLEK